MEENQYSLTSDGLHEAVTLYLMRDSVSEAVNWIRKAESNNNRVLDNTYLSVIKFYASNDKTELLSFAEHVENKELSLTQSELFYLPIINALTISGDYDKATMFFKKMLDHCTEIQSFRDTEFHLPSSEAALSFLRDLEAKNCEIDASFYCRAISLLVKESRVSEATDIAIKIAKSGRQDLEWPISVLLAHVLEESGLDETMKLIKNMKSGGLVISEGLFEGTFAHYSKTAPMDAIHALFKSMEGEYNIEATHRSCFKILQQLIARRSLNEVKSFWEMTTERDIAYSSDMWNEMFTEMTNAGLKVPEEMGAPAVSRCVDAGRFIEGYHIAMRYGTSTSVAQSLLEGLLEYKYLTEAESLCSKIRSIDTTPLDQEKQKEQHEKQLIRNFLRKSSPFQPLNHKNMFPLKE